MKRGVKGLIFMAVSVCALRTMAFWMSNPPVPMGLGRRVVYVSPTPVQYVVPRVVYQTQMQPVRYVQQAGVLTACGQTPSLTPTGTGRLSQVKRKVNDFFADLPGWGFVLLLVGLFWLFRAMCNRQSRRFDSPRYQRVGNETWVVDPAVR